MTINPDDLTVGPAGGRAVGPSRFTPGAIIAGRYRLVALLGRGGMGEVYRADDLTLDQPVALKFLPEGVADEPARLTQFHNELRTARQVSHKNVCRLYDLGEADGRRFLTMEYVDGEDLASLLRRIGRFPEDRAVAIARQLCAGVAAAHERGVIHRDLKPANVMIDGEGNVRITDFGIATAVSDASAGFAGTPQYMAPELLSGAAASTSTDIYALGLTLFEVFTGKRAFDAKTIAELRTLHDTGTVTTPSAIVRDLDPSIERVIMRCLDRDPGRRPSSALAVAAALPGGDPLAAALAAGETPSPEMLVAAGEADVMPLPHAITAIGALVVVLILYAVFSPRVTVAGLVPLDRPPAALADRAQQLVASLGYTDAPADEAYSLTLGGDYPRWIATEIQDIDRWRLLGSGGPALMLWYRSSPQALTPIRYTTDVTQVTTVDPPANISSMRTVLLDTRGRLIEFDAVPPQLDRDPAPANAPRWEPLFEAAGLSYAAFSPVTPEWTPTSYADTRAAWEGPMPDRPDIRLRVEAASYRGRPISFVTLGPWSRPARMQRLVQSKLSTAFGSFTLVLWMSVLIGSVFVARHNLRANRADRRGAARLAVAFVLLEMFAWVVGSHHVPDLNDELISVFKTLSSAAFAGGFLWTLYLALEPFGRRFWPDGLLGWTRLLSGRVVDPRVGRDIVIGCGLGAGLIAIDLGQKLAPPLIGAPRALPSLGAYVPALVGSGWLVLNWLQQLYYTVQSGLLIILVFIALRLLLRRTWLAVVLGIVIVTAASNGNPPPGGVVWLDALFAVAAIGLITLAIFRFGVLATIVTMLVDNLPTTVPYTGRLFHWSSSPAIVTTLLVLGMAAFGVYAARRPAEARRI